MSKDNDNGACTCGSTAFVEEGLASFKISVTISGSGTIECGCPELDIHTSTIKCAQCGSDYDF